jgi:DNA polymerase-3 subunit delta'
MTRSNELLPWHHQAWTHLGQFISQNRLPQALLIYGSRGLGKQQLAQRFAFSLLCDKPQVNHFNCGHCSSCLLFSAETHPDYLMIKQEEPGKAITIGQIRNLLTRLTLKPQFERYRVVIINPAEQLSNAAANAFLKYLEEPTERTVLVLITDKPAQLPATILSRCQKLLVERPSRVEQSQWLRQQNIHNDLALLYNLSQGSPLLALSYANDKLLMLRKQCFAAWLAVARKQSHPVLIAEEWYVLTEVPLLFWLTSWIIDLVKCCFHSKVGNLANPDLHEHLKELSQQLELKRIYKLYDLLLISRQRWDTQINKQSMFEEILIQWFEITRDIRDGRPDNTQTRDIVAFN